MLGWTSASPPARRLHRAGRDRRPDQGRHAADAMYGFAVFYGLCLVLNWWFYLRNGNAYVKNPLEDPLRR